MKTYWIGRSARCHIKLNHNGISRLHIELTIARDGRYYLTDCASRHGSFINNNQRWKRFKQTYIEADQPLKLAETQTTVAQLLKSIQTKSSKLQRNPETGEIMS